MKTNRRSLVTAATWTVPAVALSTRAAHAAGSGTTGSYTFTRATARDKSQSSGTQIVLCWDVTVTGTPAPITVYSALGVLTPRLNYDIIGGDQTQDNRIIAIPVNSTTTQICVTAVFGDRNTNKGVFLGYTYGNVQANPIPGTDYRLTTPNA